MLDLMSGKHIPPSHVCFPFFITIAVENETHLFSSYVSSLSCVTNFFMSMQLYDLQTLLKMIKVTSMKNCVVNFSTVVFVKVSMFDVEVSFLAGT